MRVITPTEVDMNTIGVAYFDEDSNETLDENDVNNPVDITELNGNPDNIQEIDNELDQEEGLSDIFEDLFIVSSGVLGVKTFNDLNINDSCPFVRVADGKGNPAIIKKQTLLWLRSTGNLKISADKLQRVQAEHVSHLTLSWNKGFSSSQREDFISIGDWCAFKSEDGSVVIGRILAFSYLTGTSKKNQEYSKTSAPVDTPKQYARGLGCLCSWFTIERNQKLNIINMDAHRMQ